MQNPGRGKICAVQNPGRGKNHHAIHFRPRFSRKNNSTFWLNILIVNIVFSLEFFCWFFEKPRFRPIFYHLILTKKFLAKTITSDVNLLQYPRNPTKTNKNQDYTIQHRPIYTLYICARTIAPALPKIRQTATCSLNMPTLTNIDNLRHPPALNKQKLTFYVTKCYPLPPCNPMTTPNKK